MLTEETWYINRFFATVEKIEKFIVPIGYMGVIISYHGKGDVDLNCDACSNGELVANGEHGVWKDALLPEKCAFNTCARKIKLVSMTNITLKWIQDAVSSKVEHYDENLAEVSFMARDVFELSLPPSVAIHIDYRMASMVIRRFGDVKLLVEQTLGPMVAFYFKNIGQTMTLIELI